MVRLNVVNIYVEELKHLNKCHKIICFFVEICDRSIESEKRLNLKSLKNCETYITQ